jgi:sigma-E factor negative regulatory protein RseC
MENCKVGDDNRSMLVEAHNPLGAAVGDRVRIITSSKSFLQSSFILYIVPLLALVIGALLGNFAGQRLKIGPDPDLLSAIVGVVFLISSFFVIRFASRSLPRENYLPRIAEILSEEEAFAIDLEKNGN